MSSCIFPAHPLKTYSCCIFSPHSFRKMPPPIISNTCAYVNCRNDRRHTPGLSFYRFPLKDKDRCIQWLVNSGNVKIKLGDEHLKNGVICERHFALHSFKDPAATKKSLNYNAIPRNYNDGECFGVLTRSCLSIKVAYNKMPIILKYL